jgi:outer membrane biosynthesis protein TonB
MEYFKEHKRGIVGTFIFHLIVLLLLLFLGFFTPLPLPGEEGILVNFGNSKNGFGNREPSPANRNPKPVVTKKKEQPKPKQKAIIPKATTPPPATTPKPKPAKEVAMTQDFEKTAAIDAAEKKKRDEKKKQQEKLNEERRQKKIEEERIRKAEIEKERKKQEELERQRKQEKEQRAREEAERKKRKEEQRKIAEINSRTQSAFANKGSGSGGKGSSDGKSQGATFPGGNQGVKTGDANAGNYGAGGSGTGNQGSGISFSLSGRSAISLPKPKYPGDDAGLVIVKVTVDKNGKVTSAEPGARGTTIMNQKFWNEAKQAALKAKFNVSKNAPAFQQGTISYRFVLD